MSKGYSVASALVLTDGDFNHCIDAFNQITPDANLIIQDLNETTIYVSNTKKFPVLNFAVDKSTIDNANTNRDLLRSVLGRVLDEIYYI